MQQQRSPIQSCIAKGLAPASCARGWGRREWLLAAALIVLILITFYPVWRCGFVNYDDDVYVTGNPYVQRGLTLRTLGWAWTTSRAANWHPLTWLSLLLDAQLYGPKPWGYHLTNLLLHCANTFLLFALLRRLTGEAGRSGVVAALFALHPLHVESVAWVSERKDVLSTLFGLLALLAYARYTEMPRLGRYLLVMLGLALSLLAKPMLVTLPGLLLLLDYWPLRRWRLGPEALPKSRDPAPGTASTSWLLLEKLPLLALSIASSIVTLWAQHRGGAVTSLAQHPLGQRLANAIVSYAEYLRQTAIPGDLAVFYPLAGTRLEIKMVLAAGLLIAGVTVLALRCRRRYPYLAVGWLWYLVSLIPVIGLVQVGSQARADRYTYLPLIGIFLLLTWGLADLIKRWRCQRLAACPVGLLFVYFMLVSCAQAQYWEDSVTLWKHALLVTGDNYLVQTNLGEAFLEQGDVDGAIPHLEEALRLNPRSYLAHYNRGLSNHFGGKPAEAIRHYQEALRLNPNHIPAHLNLGNALLQQGKAGEAVSHYREAVRLDPGSARVHASLGSACMRHGDLAEAVSEFQAALRLDPGLLDAYSDLGLVFQLQGEWEASVECFRRAIALEPGNASLHRSLAFSLHSGGHADDARMEYQESLRLDPDWPRLAAHEAWSLATSPDSTRRNGSLAVQRAAQALQASGKRTPELLDTLAAAYAEAGQFAQAVTLAREARSGAAAAGRMDLVEQVEHRLRLYEQGQPFHAAVAGE